MRRIHRCCCISHLRPRHRPASGEIAFESRGGIWASRADGSERRLLLAGRELAQPAWSPDGSTLAYSDADRVMVLGPAGPRAATAPRGKVGNGGAAWSPDGSAWSSIATSTTAFARRSSRTCWRPGPNVYSSACRRTAADWSAPRAGRPTARRSPHLCTRSTGARSFSTPSIRTIPAGGGASRSADPGRRSRRSGRPTAAAWRSPASSRPQRHPLWTDSVRGGTPASSTRRRGRWLSAHPADPQRGRLTRRTRRGHPTARGILFTSDQNVPHGDSSEVLSIALRRQLPHLADQRHAGERVRQLARPRSGDRLQPREL